MITDMLDKGRKGFLPNSGHRAYSVTAYYILYYLCYTYLCCTYITYISEILSSNLVWVNRYHDFFFCGFLRPMQINQYLNLSNLFHGNNPTILTYIDINLLNRRCNVRYSEIISNMCNYNEYCYKTGNKQKMQLTMLTPSTLPLKNGDYAGITQRQVQDYRECQHTDDATLNI
jgi:hypothetical protein